MNAKEKLLEVFDQAMVLVTEISQQEQAPPQVAFGAMFLPFARQALASSDPGEWQRFVDTICAIFASLSDDDVGGFVYLSPALSPTTKPFASHIGRAKYWPDGTVGFELIDRAVDVPNLCAELPAAARQLLASLPKSDPGNWLQRLGQIDTDPVVDIEVPGAPGGDRPGQ